MAQPLAEFGEAVVVAQHVHQEREGPAGREAGGCNRAPGVAAEAAASLVPPASEAMSPVEARALHERSLAIHERTLGPEHPAVATNLADLPDDPAELVLAIQLLQQRGGFGSLAVATIPRPDPTANANQNPIVTDEDAWNPDGSLRPGFDPATLLAAMMANDITDEFNDPTP